ncbi:MAG: hypothetical protein OHK0024_32560 [Thalassobaculales bacterium]
MIEWNPALARFRQAGFGGGAKGGPAAIERPGQVTNLAWQTRPAPPSAYENRLADALMAMFAEGIDTLPAVVDRLNADGIAHPDGGPWTVDNYTPALARLGA